MHSLSLLLILSFHVYGTENQHQYDPPMSDKDVEIIDNIPTACVSGDGNLGILAQDKEWCAKNKCEETVKSLKMNYDREHLAKSVKEVGGKVLDTEKDAESLRMIIDGPANLRDTPKGKIIDSFADKFIVLAEGQKDDWYFIRGYWSRECHTGWTHKSNVKFITREQIKALEKKK